MHDVAEFSTFKAMRKGVSTHGESSGCYARMYDNQKKMPIYPHNFKDYE